MATFEDYLKKEYREVSKQTDSVLEAGFILKYPKNDKKCDTCGDFLANGKEICLLFPVGMIFYFCSIDCVEDFIIEELRAIEDKVRNIII